MTTRKKLIEVALPLEAINAASAREKSIRHGHPSTLHLWWARRPLAAARAVIFSQMVDDPSAWPDLFPTEKAQDKERKRLFKIIEQLVTWENTTNEAVLQQAREEIWNSWRRACADNADHPRAGELFNRYKLPAFHDPFAGGGALPLEAQRLGLEAYASDLNPVAVLINKAMIEIPPRFAGQPPVNRGNKSKSSAGIPAGRGDYAGRDAGDTADTADTAGAARFLSFSQAMNMPGWRSRGYLPHFDRPGLLQAITFRLHDSLPAKLIEQWKEELGILAGSSGSSNTSSRGSSNTGIPAGHGGSTNTGNTGKDAGATASDTAAANELRQRIAKYEDAGHGECWLRDPRIAALVQNALLHFDGERYRLLSWCIMPNHVHVLIETFPGYTLDSVLHSWKSFTASEANKILGRSGPFWYREYYDRFIRDAGHLANAVNYIEQNPVKAGLVKQAKDWHFGSAASAPEPPASLPALEDRPARMLALPEMWHGAQGLAEDVRYYGQWMRDEAEQRIGHLYPKVEITKEMVRERPDLKPLLGQRLTVIAWIWARTVRSPNPAFAHVDVPLASTFMLSTKPGKEAYIEPVILPPSPTGRGGTSSKRSEGEAGGEGGYEFKVKVGAPRKAEAVKSGTKLARGANFACVMSGTPISDEYIKMESMSGRMGMRLMALVVEGERGRIYLSPTIEQETVALEAHPEWKPEQPMNRETRDLVSGRGYGFFTWADLFTNRQLLLLTSFSDMVNQVREHALKDAMSAQLPQDGRPLRNGGTGALAYAEIVALYCALAVSKISDYNSSLVIWSPTRDQAKGTFARQALPMVWDFGEVNPFADAAGDIRVSIDGMTKAICNFSAFTSGNVFQLDATTQVVSFNKIVSTDPPYFDNISYGDLSDYFYVWLRPALKETFPEMFSTVAVPKTEELVASAYRHGGKKLAENFFLLGMTQAMHRIAEQHHPAFPVTIYYAFKQSETEDDSGTASTGWETFLDAVIQAGFDITGTWPIRTERGSRSIGIDTNALASSIVLVCRRRDADAPTATRREFLAALKAELPAALRKLQQGNIAPVDLAQSAIGPGMAVYTRYRQVLDAEGHPLRVRDALKLINETLDEVLSAQEGDFDPDSRWALAWFEQYGFADGEFGRAETLSKAKNTSVGGMVDAGLLRSRQGKVRLLRPEELPADWDPEADNRLTAWEAVHHLVRALNEGEGAAAQLASRLGAQAEVARELAYRLYTLCERKKRAQDALAYNALVQSWPEILRLAQAQGEANETPAQGRLL